MHKCFVSSDLVICHVIEMLLQGGGGVTDAQFRAVCVRSLQSECSVFGVTGKEYT